MSKRPVQRGAVPPNSRSPADRSVGARWSKLIAEEGFTPVANAFLEAYSALESEGHEPGISSTEAMLLIHLLSFKWTIDSPFPKIPTLAARMGLTPRAVRGVVHNLEQRGFVRRVKPSGGGAQRFELEGLFVALERWITGPSVPVVAVVS